MIEAIPGLEDRYFVSRDGRVFTAINTRGRRAPLRRMKTRIGKFGYEIVQLRIDGRNRGKPVHTLVALAFLGPRNGLEVNHKDGVKLNNHVSNLEYCTRSQNVQHAFDNGLKIPARGERAGAAKLRAEMIPLIRRDVAAVRANGRAPRRSMAALAKKYGVSPSALDHIARGDCWKHI